MENLSQESEVWRDIKGYEGLYVVSNKGRVKSLGNGQTHRKEKLLCFTTSHKRYYVVTLTKNGICKSFTVHKLVAKAFVLEQNGKEQIDHIDGNSFNNCAENLRWCTSKENNLNPITRTRKSISKTGNLNPNHSSNLTETSRKRLMDSLAKAHKVSEKAVEQILNGVVVGTYISSADAENKTGINATNISRCCNGKRKSAGKYQWRFV